VRALETEIEHEATHDDNKKPCPTLEGFMTSVNGMDVALRKPHGKESITIRFAIQVTEHEDESDEDSSYSNASPVAAISSSIGGLKNLFGSAAEPEPDVEQAATGATRYFSVVVEKGRLIITHVAFFANAALAHKAAVEGDNPDITTYEGPAVSELSDALSTMWYKYLVARGINDKLGSFMISYSKFMEQKEYVAWLGQTLKFVKD
jgi:hypothetical protein